MRLLQRPFYRNLSQLLTVIIIPFFKALKDQTLKEIYHLHNFIYFFVQRLIVLDKCRVQHSVCDLNKYKITKQKYNFKLLSRESFTKTYFT